LAILVFDLFLAHFDFITPYSDKMLYPETPSITFLKQKAAGEKEPFRIMSGTVCSGGTLPVSLG
jgi:hypothetical protein